MNTSWSISFVFILCVILFSCIEVPNDNDKNLRENDGVAVIDTIPKTDSLECDTVYTCYLGAFANALYTQLLDAYLEDDVAALKIFLQEWNERYAPDTSIPDSLTEVYAVYEEFYSPWNLSRIADSEFGSDMYEGIDYYIIQSGMRYNFAFREHDSHMYTIENFRPGINNSKIDLLYLAEAYEEVLNCFLGSESQGHDPCRNITPNFPIPESYERAKFLSSYLRIIQGHWGLYWHLETHPEVEYISFNETRDSAQVYFRIAAQGGEAILGKDNEGWNIVDHYMTWIE